MVAPLSAIRAFLTQFVRKSLAANRFLDIKGVPSDICMRSQSHTTSRIFTSTTIDSIFWLYHHSLRTLVPAQIINGSNKSMLTCERQPTSENKKALLSQRWPRNALYTWVPWKFSGLPDYAHGYYSQHFLWAFVPIDPMNVPTKFEVRSFTRSWDNRGTQKIWTDPGYAHAPFSPKFLKGFYSEWPCKYFLQIWSP